MTAANIVPAVTFAVIFYGCCCTCTKYLKRTSFFTNVLFLTLRWRPYLKLPPRVQQLSRPLPLQRLHSHPKLLKILHSQITKSSSGAFPEWTGKAEHRHAQVQTARDTSKGENVQYKWWHAEFHRTALEMARNLPWTANTISA